MSRKHHYVSDCKYHIIICPKYRHKVMIKEVADFILKKIREICDNNSWNILDYSVECDHVHICVELEPTISVGNFVHKIKFITGYYIFKNFENLRKKYFWNSGFWTNGYFVSTVGNVSKEKIMEYIRNQENYKDDKK